MKRKLYQELASLVDAIANCHAKGNTEWAARHEARVHYLIKNYGPSGSGIDSGTSIRLDDCKPDKLVLFTEFHHMNEGGMYDGWTQHRVTVTPSLAFGINIKFSGPDRNQIKDYLHDVFHSFLTMEESGVRYRDEHGHFIPLYHVPMAVQKEIDGGAAFCDGWESPDGTFYRWD